MAQVLRDGDRGGIERLFFYLSRYRDAIEADLAFRGIGLNELWAQRRWRELLNLINHLPPNSFFNEAMMNDREVMMALHAMEEQAIESDDEGEERPVGIRISEVSEEARRLGELHTMLAYVVRAVMVASPRSKGGSLGKVEPYPAPIMIDGATGEWNGKPSEATRRRKERKLTNAAQLAAERYRAEHGDGK